MSSSKTTADPTQLRAAEAGRIANQTYAAIRRLGRLPALPPHLHAQLVEAAQAVEVRQ